MSADDDVHFFDGPGIEEGNGAVPGWFIGFMAVVFVVIVAYLGTYLVGAQPNTARIGGHGEGTMAEQPAQEPAESEAEDGE